VELGCPKCRFVKHGCGSCRGRQARAGQAPSLWVRHSMQVATVAYDDGDKRTHPIGELVPEVCTQPGLTAATPAALRSDDYAAPLESVDASAHAPTSSSTHQGDDAVLPPQEVEAAHMDDDQPCTACGKCDNPAQTLLCDGRDCKRPYHIYCLQPALTSVPQDKWYCPSCTESWYRSEAGSRQLARTLHEQEVRAVRNLRRQTSSDVCAP